jgi:biotin operon repressor
MSGARPKLRVISGGASSKADLLHHKKWQFAVKKDTSMSYATRTIAGYIGALLNPKKGYAYPSLERIASDTGAHKATVCRAIQTLTDHGYLLVRPGGGRGRANEYHLEIPEPLPAAETVAPVRPFENAKTVAGRVARLVEIG